MIDGTYSTLLTQVDNLIWHDIFELVRIYELFSIVCYKSFDITFVK